MFIVNIESKRKPLTPNSPARRVRGYFNVDRVLWNDKGKSMGNGLGEEAFSLVSRSPKTQQSIEKAGPTH